MLLFVKYPYLYCSWFLKDSEKHRVGMEQAFNRGKQLDYWARTVFIWIWTEAPDMSELWVTKFLLPLFLGRAENKLLSRDPFQWEEGGGFLGSGTLD